MPIFLQQVDLPERCFLAEVLLWVAFKRLPVAVFTPDGKEIRETDRIDSYEIHAINAVLSEDETKGAGILA